MDDEEELYSLLTKTQLLFEDVENIFLHKYGLGNTRYYTLVHLLQSPGDSNNAHNAWRNAYVGGLKCAQPQVVQSPCR